MPASKLRFSTAHFLYASLLTASSVSLFGKLGLPVAAGVLLLWWQIISGAMREHAGNSAPTETTSDRPNFARSKRAGFNRVEVALAMMTTGTLVCLLMPPRSDYDAMQQASNSMQQIARAIESYEAKHQCKLPHALVDTNGHPMHSWRALILADLGEQKLADAYRFDEPWNGPNNILLADYRPWHYRPFYPSQDPVDDDALDRSTTSVHLNDCAGHRCVVEHELHLTNWLTPDAQLPPSAFCAPPVESDGFWNHGILASTHRGRIMASPKAVEYLHGQRSYLQESGDESPQTVYHIDILMHAAVFALVALYPLRWLRTIQP